CFSLACDRTLPPAPACGASCLQPFRIYIAGRNGLYMRSWKQAELPVGHHGLPGGNSFIDHYSLADADSHRHFSEFHGLIRLGYVNELALLARLNGLRGDDDGIVSCIQRERHVHELPWPEQALGILEGRLEADRTRRGINRVVDDRENSRNVLLRVVLRSGFDRELPHTAAPANRAQMFFRDAERYEYRGNLVDHHKRLVAVGLDQVALVHQQIARTARNRRPDLTVTEVELRPVHGGQVALKRGPGSVDGRLVGLRARHNAFPQQRLIARGVGIREFQLRPVASKIRFCLGQLRPVFGYGGFSLPQSLLVRPWIDLKQQVAFFDIAALDKVYTHQFAGDLRLDLHDLGCFHGPDGMNLNRHRLLNSRGHADRNSRRRSGGSHLFRSIAAARKQENAAEYIQYGRRQELGMQ